MQPGRPSSCSPTLWIAQPLPFPVPFCSPLAPCTQQDGDKQPESHGGRHGANSSTLLDAAVGLLPVKLLGFTGSYLKCPSFSFVPSRAVIFIPTISPCLRRVSG